MDSGSEVEIVGNEPNQQFKTGSVEHLLHCLIFFKDSIPADQDKFKDFIRGHYTVNFSEKTMKKAWKILSKTDAFKRDQSRKSQLHSTPEVKKKRKSKSKSTSEEGSDICAQLLIGNILEITPRTREKKKKSKRRRESKSE